MSKCEMTRVNVPNWLTHSKTIRSIDEINTELDKLVLSASTDTKADREELLASAMNGEISAAEFTKRLAKIKNATTQSEIDVATVKLLKAKRELAPKIRELANEAAATWERKAFDREREIKDSLAKLELREAERTTILRTEQTLRRLRDTARSIQAQAENFWTSSDSELLQTIESRLRQTLGIFNTSN